MLAFKSGVRLRAAAPAITHILTTIDDASERPDIRAVVKGDLTITSGHDGTHASDSRHYRDEAIDVRTHNINADRREWLRGVLEHLLNRQFDRLYFRVLHEHPGTTNEHFHIQVRMGMRYPASDSSRPSPT